ncbi:hypothetical protein H1R20_g16265, partial [Candolleomyces eurysporus]
MVKFTAFASITALLLASVPFAFAQDLGACATRCEAVGEKISACNDNTACACATQVFNDLDACKKCLTDASINPPDFVSGYAELCAAVSSLESLTSTGTNTAPSTSTGTSTSTPRPNNNGASAVGMSAGVIGGAVAVAFLGL